MINKEFALGTYEINLQSDVEREFIYDTMSRYCCSYIDTAIDYNNDYLIDSENFKVISKIAPCHFDYYEFFVDNHLKCLNRTFIDIMLIHSSRRNWEPLALRIENDQRFIEVGVSNFNVEELERYRAIIGHYPKYNEIEINPYYADIDTINFCKQNNIKIIAYGIFGGKYNAMTNIADFSLPYLISFASHYADIVIVKPESFRHVDEIIDVILEYNVDETLSFDVLDNNKAIVPMRYTAKDIKKTCLGVETYHIACGKNTNYNNFEKIEIKEDFPDFEMLGDYMTWLRYKHRKNYEDFTPYYYDMLIGDDGNYYVVYLYDEKDRITKINEFNKIKAYMIVTNKE